MVHQFWRSPQNIELDSTFEISEFTDIEYRNGANAGILARSKVLVKMQNDKIPFNRNNFDHSVLDAYTNEEEEDNSMQEVGDFGVFNNDDASDPFSALELHGEFDSQPIDERFFYTKMESKLKSLAKLCETLPTERQHVLDGMTTLEAYLMKKCIANVVVSSHSH